MCSKIYNCCKDFLILLSFRSKPEEKINEEPIVLYGDVYNQIMER